LDKRTVVISICYKVTCICWCESTQASDSSWWSCAAVHSNSWTHMWHHIFKTLILTTYLVPGIWNQFF